MRSSLIATKMRGVWSCCTTTSESMAPCLTPSRRVRDLPGNCTEGIRHDIKRKYFGVRQLIMKKHYWKQMLPSVLFGMSLTGIAQANNLTELLRQTLDNPAISAREMQLQAATEDASAANMRYFGQASVFAGQSTYDSPRIVGVFAPGVTPLPVPVSSDITQFGVNYHLPVDLFGSISAERQQAQANKTAAQLLERQETLLRLHQTLGAYVRLQALSIQSQALLTEQKQLEVFAERVREEVKLGRTAKIDLSQLQSDLSRLAAQQAIFAGNQRAAYAALKASANVIDPMISAIIEVPVLQKSDAQESLPVLLANEQLKAAEAFFIPTGSMGIFILRPTDHTLCG